MMMGRNQNQLRLIEYFDGICALLSVCPLGREGEAERESVEQNISNTYRKDGDIYQFIQSPIVIKGKLSP
jgi:hypothetical protein